jgi:AraC-like DNA-binding protein
LTRNHNRVILNYPNAISNYKDTPHGEFVTPSSGVIEHESDVIDIRLKDMFLPNFFIRISEGSVHENAVFLNHSCEGLGLLGSCLLLKGKGTSHMDGHGETLEAFHGSQNFKYDPQNIFHHRFPANSAFHIAHFAVDPDYFFQFLPDDERWADTLKNKIAKKESMMGGRYTAISLMQERALQNILECPLDGKLGILMMESSIVQIMVLQMHSLFENAPDKLFDLTQREKDTIHDLKNYLNKSFLEDHSLDNLARQFGTNTNKLMCLFKKLFGKSIFEYLSELKMEHARQLLEHSDQLVAEIAREVGYKNPNHFSAAFKKKFGITPAQVRA